MAMASFRLVYTLNATRFWSLERQILLFTFFYVRVYDYFESVDIFLLFDRSPLNITNEWIEKPSTYQHFFMNLKRPFTEKHKSYAFKFGRWTSLSLSLSLFLPFYLYLLKMIIKPFGTALASWPLLHGEMNL